MSESEDWRPLIQTQQPLLSDGYTGIHASELPDHWWVKGPGPKPNQPSHKLNDLVKTKYNTAGRCVYSEMQIFVPKGTEGMVTKVVKTAMEDTRDPPYMYQIAFENPSSRIMTVINWFQQSDMWSMEIK